MQPIWKDYYFSLGSGTYADFEVRAGSEVVFSGRAYKRPGEGEINIRVNDICANYLRELLPDSAGYTTFALAATFSVVYYSGGEWVSAGSVDFYYDWSYDYSFDPATMPLAQPIGPLDPRQLLIFSVLNPGTLTATITHADGTTESVPLATATSGSFSSAFNESYARESTSGPGAAVLDLSQYADVVSVAVGGVRYEVKQTCSRYAVYYVNAYGGWDALVLDGYKRTDNLVRHTNLVDYDNRQQRNRGRRDYAIEVSPTWRLATDWLTDAQAERMHHLLNSPFVYLCDLETGDFLPVLLTDTATEYKRHRVDGMIRYEFNAQLAQEQFRR